MRAQVHFHIIPAPTFGVANADHDGSEKSRESNNGPMTMREMHRSELESREELEEDEATILAKKISARM